MVVTWWIVCFFAMCTLPFTGLVCINVKVRRRTLTVNLCCLEVRHIYMNTS